MTILSPRCEVARHSAPWGWASKFLTPCFVVRTPSSRLFCHPPKCGATGRRRQNAEERTTHHAHGRTRTSYTVHKLLPHHTKQELYAMSVVASLPRLDSFGGALPRLDSLGAGQEDMDDLSIEHLLEGYPDFHQEWDMGSTTMFAEPAQVHEAAPKAFTPWQPEKTVGISKKRKQAVPTVAAKQQEQVMQMPGAWFDMPEFAPMDDQMQNAMTDDMMFDAINEAVANQTLAIFQNDISRTPVNDDPPPYSVDEPPPYSPPTNEMRANLDANILGFFKTGDLRDVLLNDRSEKAAPTGVVEAVSSTPAVCEESATPQQKITRGPYQFTFGVDPDPKIAAKKRAVRESALSRYRQKKIDRANHPVIRYKSRKKIADNRPRVKGRFIKTDNTVRAEAQPAATKA